LPQAPDAIPYVTSYYQRNWGFCLPHRQRERLPPGQYRAVIESTFVSGGIPFGQCVLGGQSDEEIVISSYLCHPSLANNELSGPLALVALYLAIARWPRRRFSYRFVLNPETIGSLCYLFRHGDHLREHMIAGVVLTCLGGPAEDLSYKLSRRGNSLLDRTVLSVARHIPLRIRDFDPTDGSDERQYCSPGFNLPVGQFARTVYGEFDGYHNSLDTKEFMRIGQVVDSAAQIERLLKTMEIAGRFRNLTPYGEPQLGKRGLYPNMNAASTWGNSNDHAQDARASLKRLLRVLNYADGVHRMADVAARAGGPIEEYRDAIEKLEKAGLLALGRNVEPA
jgi:aminopeptidase-like protein